MRHRRRIDHDRGAAMVEFGIVIIPLLGVLVGIVTAGLAYFKGIQLDTAAQEGARVMYVGGSVEDAKQAVVNAGNVDPPVTAAEVVVAGTCIPATIPPSTVHVTVQRDATIHWIFGSHTVSLTGRGVTRCQ